MSDDPKRRRAPLCGCCGKNIEEAQGMVEYVENRGHGWKCVCGWWTWCSDGSQRNRRTPMPDDPKRRRAPDPDERPEYDEREAELDVAGAELGWDGATTAEERDRERRRVLLPAGIPETVEVSVDDARLILEAYDQWNHRNEREYSLAISRLRDALGEVRPDA